MPDETESPIPAPGGGATGVLAEVAAERARQDAQWGGPAHDDEHGIDEWGALRAKHDARMLDVAWNESPFDAARWRAVTRESLIKIAALCVAQVESLDRGAGEDAAASDNAGGAPS